MFVCNGKKIVFFYKKMWYNVSMDKYTAQHSGHRKRLVEKFLAKPEILTEHELLEIILFDAIPRKNTNGVAHKLLDEFGTIKRVLSATPQEIMAIEGVGKAVVAKLQMTGMLLKTIHQKTQQPQSTDLTFNLVRDKVVSEISCCETENFMIYFYDANYNQLGCVKIESPLVDRVDMEAEEIEKMAKAFSPTYAIMAHNHPSGFSNPSWQDDVNTKRVIIMLSKHQVTVLDHVIVGGESAFSYFLSSRLSHVNDFIQNQRLLSGKIDVDVFNDKDEKELLKYLNNQGVYNE